MNQALLPPVRQLALEYLRDEERSILALLIPDEYKDTEIDAKDQSSVKRGTSSIPAAQQIIKYEGFHSSQPSAPFIDQRNHRFIAESGWMAALDAVYYGGRSIDIADMFLAAARGGQAEILRRLCKIGLLTYRTLIDRALVFAMTSADPKNAIDVLVDLGDPDFDAILRLACDINEPKAVKYLTSKGANGDGMLYDAARRGQVDILICLYDCTSEYGRKSFSYYMELFVYEQIIQFQSATALSEKKLIAKRLKQLKAWAKFDPAWLPAMLNQAGSHLADDHPIRTFLEKWWAGSKGGFALRAKTPL